MKISLCIEINVKTEEEAQETWMFLFQKYFPTNDFYWEIDGKRVEVLK